MTKKKSKAKLGKENESLQAYHKFIGRKITTIILLIVGIFLISVFAINAGSSDMTIGEVFSTIIGKGTSKHNIVVMRIRLPRVIAGIIAGAGLSIAGCVMQNNLRNPLASPSTLGITNAAAFGANFAIIVLGAGSVQSSSADAVNIRNPYMVTVSAFLWAIFAAVIVIFLAKVRDFSPEVIVLAGVAIGSLFTAGTTVIQYFARDNEVAAAVFWTFGDLGRVSWKEVGILAVVVIISIVYFMIRRWDYNAMDGGEETAKSLGVEVERVRLGGMIAASLLTAVAVSFLGIIGFIGLIGPQIMRRVIGSDHRFLIPASALTGSLVLLLSDTIARTIMSPIILPVGVVTSFLGAPLFLYLLIKGHPKSH